MKKINNILVICLSLLALFGCEGNDKIVGEPVEIKTMGKMGYRSTLNSSYMLYNGDSAILKFRVEEIELPMRHYNKYSFFIGEQNIASANHLPYEMEIHIPIIEDSTFYFKHICAVDSIVSMSDTLLHAVYVHKSEIVNANPDIVRMEVERVDSIVIKKYFADPDKFGWLAF